MWPATPLPMVLQNFHLAIFCSLIEIKLMMFSLDRTFWVHIAFLKQQSRMWGFVSVVSDLNHFNVISIVTELKLVENGQNTKKHILNSYHLPCILEHWLVVTTNFWLNLEPMPGFRFISEIIQGVNSSCCILTLNFDLIGFLRYGTSASWWEWAKSCEYLHLNLQWSTTFQTF